MAKLQNNKIFSALPPWAGGKRKLLPRIFSEVASLIPASEWPNTSFADGFCGGGSVSLAAKALGFGRIYSNDCSNLSNIILKALIENEAEHLKEDDLYRLLACLVSQEAGFIESRYGGTVLPTQVARAIDGVHANMQILQSQTKQQLVYLYLWHLIAYKTAFSTSIGRSNSPFSQVIDGTRDWWTLNSKRLTDGSLSGLIEPVYDTSQKILKRINGGVFKASGEVSTCQMDVFDFVKHIHPDVLYFDAPYPETLSYEKENRVLESLVFGSEPPVVDQVSPFTESTTALSDLLLQCRHCPVWVLSYGNKVLDLEGLIQLVRSSAGERYEVTGWEIPYTHFQHVSKNQNNLELLVTAVDKNFGGVRR